MKKGYLTTSDRARIYYEDRGLGTPLLFIPGHMCTGRFFEKNVVGLAEHYRVVTMDPRGFGNSSKVLYGMNLERFSDDVKELIEYLELEDVMLIGWSLGGSIAMMYAHRYCERHLKAITLIDCALFPFSSEDWNCYSARDYNMDDWCNKYKAWYIDADKYYCNFMKRIDRGMKEDDVKFLRCEIEKTPPWIGVAIHTDWCHTDMEQYLKDLSVPALIASGEDETMCRHYYEEIKSYKEIHTFEKGGHALFWIEYERFNRVLKLFMEQIRKDGLEIIS